MSDPHSKWCERDNSRGIEFIFLKFDTHVVSSSAPSWITSPSHGWNAEVRVSEKEMTWLIFILVWLVMDTFDIGCRKQHIVSLCSHQYIQTRMAFTVHVEAEKIPTPLRHAHTHRYEMNCSQHNRTQERWPFRWADPKSRMISTHATTFLSSFFDRCPIIFRYFRKSILQEKCKSTLVFTQNLLSIRFYAWQSHNS